MWKMPPLPGPVRPPKPSLPPGSRVDLIILGVAIGVAAFLVVVVFAGFFVNVLQHG
jgi:hypothetical protein